MGFTVIGEIEEIETFAIGRRIHEVKRLRKKYGRGRWRKRKGLATVRLSDGAVTSIKSHGKTTSPLRGLCSKRRV